MTYLLDTNAVSDLMTEHPALSARLAAVMPADDVVICAITLGEILAGIGRLPAGKRRTDLEAKAQRVLPAFSCESITETAARRYSQLKNEMMKSGTTLSENDLWIAATALAITARLVTRDGDFRSASALTVEDWTV